MSGYNDYNVTSKTYDTRRVPFGADIYLGQLVVRLGRPLSSMKVVDLGCGTGNYAEVFLENGIGKMVCVDASEGMLAKAENKLARFGKDRIESIFQHELPSFPSRLQEGTFDGAMLNFVLHHIESVRFDKHDRSAGTGLASDYPNHLETFKTAHKLLKPGGLIMISVCSKFQFESLYWCKYCSSDILNYVNKLVPTIEVSGKLLEEARFGEIARIVLPKKYFTLDEAYMFDPKGPFDPAWREVTSIWALMTDSELETVLQRISEDEQTGELDKIIAESRKNLDAAGCATFLVAKKM